MKLTKLVEQLVTNAHGDTEVMVFDESTNKYYEVEELRWSVLDHAIIIHVLKVANNGYKVEDYENLRHQHHNSYLMELTQDNPVERQEHWFCEDCGEEFIRSGTRLVH